MHFKNLDVWMLAESLAVDVYAITNDFPPRETYVLASEMRRAALSVPSNIAESQGRLTKGECFRLFRSSVSSALQIPVTETTSSNVVTPSASFLSAD